jgi:hypothetical protein
VTSEWWLWLWALGVTEIEVLGPNWSLLAVTALRASGLVIGLVVAGLSGRALCRGPPARPTTIGMGVAACCPIRLDRPVLDLVT